MKISGSLKTEEEREGGGVCEKTIRFDNELKI